ncbi:terpenoid synthase [Atractiella rhizophila]|nr:terpenoid synthase [Atractiella rhizophila]
MSSETSDARLQRESSGLNKYDSMLSRLSQPVIWHKGNDSMLLEPFNYLAAIPGKEFRSALIDAFNAWLKVENETLDRIKRIVGMLHNASLLMDDVEDFSELRRGQPVAHKIYGVPQTLNCANYVYFLVYSELSLLQTIREVQRPIPEMITEEMINLHRGQGMDLFWRDNLVCPTEDEYIQMVNNKTGGLFRIAIKLMMATSPECTVSDYTPIVNLIGVAFQIQDDFLNLQSNQYTKNKGYCEDLTEGKFSFPVIHSIRSDPHDRRILNVLRQKPKEESLKSHAVEYMRDCTKSFEYTQQVLDSLWDQAETEIKRLGGNVALERIVRGMREMGISKEG